MKTMIYELDRTLLTSDAKIELERELKNRIDYFYLRTDGKYEFPNSQEGDLLKMILKVVNTQ